MALSTADSRSQQRTSPRTKLLWLILGLPVALVLVVLGAQIHGLDFTVYREGARAFLANGQTRARGRPLPTSIITARESTGG
ncbi:hypothetical protein QNO00_16795 [Arthrobacter sp. zg-Y1219]|uniref:hypothetical protein n=1 Tax=Arthrobacter sp. zg-Y1219 TaxID=3049067 RepID=UPI0024C44F71|nr:hypothetical protein [Arthrobacter sp. zg-Y1219]MDK1361911.1 hypothetical protein [Arthrobacter sp. zg-Y1219]